MADADTFYESIPPFGDFDRVVDRAIYRPLPPDWVVGLSDVVGSTAAIEAGRYKSVNLAGAAVISAVMNACPDLTFPFVFGGDGANLAVPGSYADRVAGALRATARWVADELDLELRVALVPVAEILAAGQTVDVARYTTAPGNHFAMFSGGGLHWAEEKMKGGTFALAPDPDAIPDLTGLSCRWAPIRAHHGEIVSLLVMAGPAGDEPAFHAFIHDIVRLVRSTERNGHPVPEEGPPFAWPPKGLDMEARAACPPGKRLSFKLKVLAVQLFGVFLDAFGLRAGRFEPSRYRRVTAGNTDFRKYDDGLRMTIDVDRQTSRRIEHLLEEAEAGGLIRYGLHRQKEALMTCIVPSYVQDNHVHFLDGAGGGYAEAARRLKVMAAADREG